MAAVALVPMLLGHVGHVLVCVGTTCCMNRGLYMHTLWESIPTPFFALFLAQGFVGRVFLWPLGPIASCFLVSSNVAFFRTEFLVHSSLICNLELVPIYLGHCRFGTTYGYVQRVHLLLSLFLPSKVAWTSYFL